MKKGILILLMFVLASLTYAAVFEIQNESEKFLVTMINQEPDPVEPGNVVEVRFRVENRQFEIKKNMEVKLIPKFPLSIYRSTDEIKSIGTLAPGQSDEAGVLVKFGLLVDKDAIGGSILVEFWYRIDGGAWTKAGDYYVEVRNRDAVLAINEIQTGSKKILPGSTTKITFSLENMANSVLKDIKLKLDLLTSVTTATGIVQSELPFTPIGSSNEKTLGNIAGKKSSTISFDLFTDANADSKVYKVPYSLTYSDEVGTNYSRSGIVGLMVDVEPDVSVNVDSTDIYSAGSKGSVTIKFVNKGFSDVKFLDVFLQETQQFDILSNPEVYIGNIDSDDYESADYDLLVKSDAGDELTLPVKFEYRDANGKLYSKDTSLKIELFSGEDLKQRVGNGGNGAVGIVIIVVIIIAGILIWRWRKKKKSK